MENKQPYGPDNGLSRQEIFEIAATRAILLESPEFALVWAERFADARNHSVRKIWEGVRGGRSLAEMMAGVSLPDVTETLALVAPEMLGATPDALVDAAVSERWRAKLERAIDLARVRLDNGEHPADVMASLQAEARGVGAAKVKKMADFVDAIGDETVGTIDTGIAAFGRYFGGWARKQVNVVVMPPGTGKTAMMFQSALAAARAGNTVLFASTEMDGDALLQRQAALRLGLALWQIKDAPPETLAKLREVAEKWRPLLEKVSFIETIRADEIIAAAQQVQPDLIVVDHLADMLMTGRDSSLSDNHGKAKGILSALKEVARQIDAAVLVAHQTNRASDDAKAGYHLIAYSSIIEQFAAVVVMLLPWRVDETVLTGKVLKARFGNIGNVTVQKSGGRFLSADFRDIGQNSSSKPGGEKNGDELVVDAARPQEFVNFMEV